MSKEELKKTLSKLKKEELIEMLLETHPVKKNRRRGKGHRKRKFQNKTATNNSNDDNKFDDFMETMKLSSSEQAELELASKMDAASKPSPRTTRRERALMEVVCRVCGSREQVSPVMVYDVNRWKCNKCASCAG